MEPDSGTNTSNNIVKFSTSAVFCQTAEKYFTISFDSQTRKTKLIYKTWTTAMFFLIIKAS